MLVGGAVLAALVMFFVFRSEQVHEEGAGIVEEVQTEEAGDVPVQLSGRRGDRRPGSDPASKDAEAIDYLREQFGATITNKRSQIKALEKLIGYLMKAYPDDWEDRLQAMLAQAFPGLAGQLYAQYQNMSAYNQWLSASREELGLMTPGEKRDAMRDARFRFFGDDAAEIWEEAIRNEKIYDTMDAINQSPNSGVPEKFNSYLDAINESYGEQAPQFIEKRQTELLTNFLALPGVQDDLHTLSAPEREQQLTEIRQGMGMDQEALDRWNKLDAERDSAWSAGEDYMEQREQIAKSYQGDEQDRRIRELREQTFGEDAATIGDEEASGFFRYGHRRIYGKE